MDGWILGVLVVVVSWFMVCFYYYYFGSCGRIARVRGCVTTVFSRVLFEGLHYYYYIYSSFLC